MQSRRAFTLIELLVVIVIIAILAGISLPMYNRFLIQARETKTLSNLRQVGAAALLYAGDNNQQLPSRVPDGSGGTKWPTLLQPYLPDPRVFSSPIPPYNGTAYTPVTDQTLYFKVPATTNYTYYIYNGWSDMAANAANTVSPPLSLMAAPSQTILFGIRVPNALQSGQFYMDFSNSDNATSPTAAVINETAFPNGSPYTFGDGSARVLTFDSQLSVTYKTSQPPSSGTYSDWYWLMNKDPTVASSTIH